jgi:hypothetical protein
MSGLFLGELVWFVPLLGEGKQSREQIQNAFLGCGNAIYNSLSGCRNAGL